MRENKKKCRNMIISSTAITQPIISFLGALRSYFLYSSMLPVWIITGFLVYPSYQQNNSTDNSTSTDDFDYSRCREFFEMLFNVIFQIFQLLGAYSTEVYCILIASRISQKNVQLFALLMHYTLVMKQILLKNS